MKDWFSKQILIKMGLSVVFLSMGILSYTLVLDKVLKKTSLERLDSRGSAYFSETLKRAAYTFAVARGINGVISVIQGTELSISPWGLGVTLSVGEILDPVNDLVERFSWVMLVSTTSLGIQKILMEIGAWFGLKVLITLAMVVLIIGLWVPSAPGAALRRLGFKLIILSLVVRFCLPIVALIGDTTYNLFLKEKYTASTRSLEEIKTEIKDPTLQEGQDTADQEENGNFWDHLKSKHTNMSELLDIRQRLARLKETVSHATEYLINLTVVFVLQTIILPLIVLWGLIRLTGNLIRPNISRAVEEKFKALMRGPSGRLS